MLLSGFLCCCTVLFFFIYFQPFSVRGDKISAPLKRVLKVKNERPHANGLPPNAATPTENNSVAKNSLTKPHQNSHFDI